ncbi:MAG: NUDIX domain-containing protein, partial [Candidatus Woesearchaeota archaeon]
MDNSRENLPLRRNCEGFFFTQTNHIVAQKTPYGIIFPGGGIDDCELPQEGMTRETHEETGIFVNKLELICTKTFVWDESWAKTQKQKQRYSRYKGDTMYFFTGKVSSNSVDNMSNEDAWKGS